MRLGDRRGVSVVAAPAGWALGALFAGVGLVRRDRPLHPKGRVVEAVLRRTGAGEPFGAAWLDEGGVDRGLVRLSRSVGLPDGLPDILGLAFSFRSADGGRHDLLLASTGLGAASRFVLTPRRDSLNATYGCLFPYSAARGLVMLAAVPAERRPAVGIDDLGDAGVWPVSFRMLAAPPQGGWRQFGELTLVGPGENGATEAFRFDPVEFPLPGLSWQPWLARLREPAYAAGRRVAPSQQ